ncbi:MAG: glycosyl transferase, partial [Casimicrobiaceae bacterium]
MTNVARRVIVVAGMHRAGTSVVARGLMALGVDLGDALMSADVKMNARGFFEDMDIVARDDALLDGQGADWKSLALLDGVDWDAAAHAGARSAARHLLEGKLARTGQYGFKDPRVPRLLPFWQRVLAEMQVA